MLLGIPPNGADPDAGVASRGAEAAPTLDCIRGAEAAPTLDCNRGAAWLPDALRPALSSPK
jgi:hypothetical protein